MLFVKYLATTIGFGLLLSVAGLLIYDLYRIIRPRPVPNEPNSVEAAR